MHKTKSKPEAWSTILNLTIIAHHLYIKMHIYRYILYIHTNILLYNLLKIWSLIKWDEPTIFPCSFLYINIKQKHSATHSEIKYIWRALSAVCIYSRTVNFGILQVLKKLSKFGSGDKKTIFRYTFDNTCDLFFFNEIQQG